MAFCKLEADTAMRDREVRVVVQALRSLNERVSTGDNRSTISKVSACTTLNNIARLCSFVSGMTRAVGRGAMRVADLV